MNHQRKKRKAKRRAKPFALSPRLQALLPHWRALDGLPPKLTACVDTCSLSEVYARLGRGEYDAVRDGASLKISTASIIARRNKIQTRAEFASA